MRETYACTFSDCDKVFSRAYELKKHTAEHENPHSVFHCPRCDFITLTKRSLAVHFANHTGEKDHECPDMIRSGTLEHRCDYKTNDPAALTRHRKKIHGYTPRQRAAPAAARKTRQKQSEKVPRRRKRSQRAAPARRKAPRAPRKAKNPVGNTSTPALPQEDEDGDTMDADCYEDVGYDSSSATLVGTDDEIGLDTLFDSSLRSQWMAKFEMSYSSFDMSGLRHQLEPLSEESESPFDPAVLDAKTGREGCLCPEWMVEVGVEGWDQAVLEPHKEYYAIDV
ncbi:hypothetical protein OG21DRAFT_1494941 [Imleria badia]|nr:hypothetical protein OG21DRAFT_1494941 [Imleria badia]